MIKLLALDIDNTITEQDGTIAPQTVAAIKKASLVGVKIVLVSARPPQGIDTIVSILKIDAYKIAYLGAVTQKPDSTEIRRLALGIDVARKIAQFADAYGLSITLNIGDVEFQSQNAARPSMTPHVSIDRAETALAMGVPPVIIATRDHEPSVSVYDYCLSNYSEYVHAVRQVNSAGLYESTLIVHPEADKGKSLLRLCQDLAISPSEVMAIGDNEGDAMMFSAVGFGVAVGNADAKAINAARFIAPFSYGQGVKWAIENLVLQG